MRVGTTLGMAMRRDPHNRSGSCSAQLADARQLGLLTFMPRRSLVLLAEDNPDERDMYAIYLRMTGFEVLVVDNGLDALHVAEKTAPDVIVLDMVMPVLGGAETAQRLKGCSRLAHIPVVAISAYSYEVFRALAPEIGADAYVLKPCGPDELAALLKRMV
jgi:two-component system cell cycle response regulator DivK